MNGNRCMCIFIIITLFDSPEMSTVGIWLNGISSTLSNDPIEKVCLRTSRAAADTSTDNERLPP
jgi:hypothetical protein